MTAPRAFTFQDCSALGYIPRGFLCIATPFPLVIFSELSISNTHYMLLMERVIIINTACITYDAMFMHNMAHISLGGRAGNSFVISIEATTMYNAIRSQPWPLVSENVFCTLFFLASGGLLSPLETCFEVGR